MFYIFYNDGKCRVHEGSCRYCNDGKGIHGVQAGLWHGPYPTQEAAFTAARRKGWHPLPCGFCKRKRWIQQREQAYPLYSAEFNEEHRERR